MPATGGEIDRLIELLARLPGLGPRSARRAALRLLSRKETLLAPLAAAMTAAADQVRPCQRCGNFAVSDMCDICKDPERDPRQICVVEAVADLWAFERAGSFRGGYHVLGGVLTAIGDVRPEDLRIPQLVERAQAGVEEVVLALSATFDGQTTALYIADRLRGGGARITRIGYGVPIGGELDYLDADTISAAFRARAEA